MTQRNNRLRFLLPVWVIALLLNGSVLQAQNFQNNAPVLLAAAVPATPVTIVRTSNIEFPEMLQGNEEQTLDYIERFSRNRRDYVIRMFTKGKKFLPKAASILKKYHLPAELRVLLTLESAYNGNAVSNAGAVGFWQIMDNVAREYGMHYVPHYTPIELKKIQKKNPAKADSISKALAKEKDDRMHFLKATQVAARYLRDRRVNLNDNWLLVVASYNCGVGNVWEAMRKSGLSNPSFWDIREQLPEETQAYVMNFITLNVLFHNFEKFRKNQLQFHPVVIPAPATPELGTSGTEHCF